MLYNIKNKHSMEKQTKNICSINQKDKSDADTLVNLEIEGYHIRQDISQELLNLVHNDKSVAQFIDMLYNIKNKHSM